MRVVSCPRTQHDVAGQARTRTARSGVARTNHEATAPTTTLHDWLKKLTPLFHPIRSKTKTNRCVLAHFPRASCQFLYVYLLWVLIAYLDSYNMITQNIFYKFCRLCVHLSLQFNQNSTAIRYTLTLKKKYRPLTQYSRNG